MNREKREREREKREKRERGGGGSNTGKNRSCQFFVSLGGCTGHGMTGRRATRTGVMMMLGKDEAKVCAIRAQRYLLIAILVFGLLTVAFMPETILGRRRMLEASRRAGN